MRILFLRGFIEMSCSQNYSSDISIDQLEEYLELKKILKPVEDPSWS